MKSKGVIVGKQVLINLKEENLDIDIAHFHEHGDFFYYSLEDLENKTDYYWVENKNDLEGNFIQVTELIPFTSTGYNKEMCQDCSTPIPNREIRYRIPYTRCESCFNDAIKNGSSD